MSGRRHPLAVVAVLAASTALLPAPAARAADPAPHLAIALDDGREHARPGDRLTWTVTLRNLGAEPVTGLRVAQDLPAGARPVTASGDAAPGAGQPAWDGLTLDPGATRTLTATAELTETGPEVLRASSTACAYQGDSRQPLVCASHLDLLPAGEPVAAPDGRGRLLPLVGAAAAGGAVAAGAWALLRARRRRAS
ncbi:hypothetical protein [Kitasatospora sp. NPDC101183]|uniref:hypothetical protein n=1 Tax=Kitasatospora sp. NPDC101183 TaxID=3364100 RepID=UPI00381D52C9